jgi:phosphatidylglycerophosphatase A
MKFRLYSAIASLAGIGFLPVAPGTWASLAAVACWYAGQALFPSFGTLQWFWVAAAVAAGYFSIRKVTAQWGEDPSQVVVDELAGCWVACLAVPHHAGALLTAFVFFRLFDIFKPLGIRKLESLPGAPGVLLDDLLAGVYANCCTHALLGLGLWNARPAYLN